LKSSIEFLGARQKLLKELILLAITGGLLLLHLWHGLLIHVHLLLVRRLLVRNGVLRDEGLLLLVASEVLGAALVSSLEVRLETLVHRVLREIHLLLLQTSLLLLLDLLD